MRKTPEFNELLKKIKGHSLASPFTHDRISLTQPLMLNQKR
jgi:hypothetical protein